MIFKVLSNPNRSMMKR